jgi:serine protease
VDLAAPGELVSTLWPMRNNPYFATPNCLFPGTTGCYSTGGAAGESWGPSGTSFATAMVSAAAAIVFGAHPGLHPEQVATLLRETARPTADPRHQVGAGVVDIVAALKRVRAGSIPRADYGEPNDRAAEAAQVRATGVISATLDWGDDPADVYRLALRNGDTLVLDSHGSGSLSISVSGCMTSAVSMSLGRRLRSVARCSGRYVLRIAATAGTRGRYRLALKRR